MDECLSAVKNQDCYAAIINSLYAQKLQNEDIRSVYSFTKLSEGTLKLKIAVKQSLGSAVLTALNDAIDATSEDSFNAIVSRFSHFVKPTPSFFDQVYLNPVPYTIGFGSLFLVFIAIIFIIFFAGRRKATLLANREFKRFITYVCQTNEAVFEVNLQTRMINHYQLEKGEVKNIPQAFSLHPDFIDKIAPEDQAMVAEEMDEKTLRPLIELGGEKAFETRLCKEDGTYFWTYIIIQGIVPTRAQPANYMWVKKAHALANPALICLVSINLAINSINTLSYYRWIGNPDKTQLNVWLAAGIIDCSTGYRIDGIWDLSIFSIWLGMVFGLLYREGEGEKQLA